MYLNLFSLSNVVRKFSILCFLCIAIASFAEEKTSFHPLQAQSQDGSLIIEAQLTHLAPTEYEISIKGLEEGERYKTVSISGEEILEYEMAYNAHSKISHCPGVLGKEGGKCIFMITDMKGRRARICLPWGSQLF